MGICTITERQMIKIIRDYIIENYRSQRQFAFELGINPQELSAMLTFHNRVRRPSSTILAMMGYEEERTVKFRYRRIA